MNYKKELGLTFGLIVLYAVFGSIFLYFGTTIDDDFPVQNFKFNENEPRLMTLQNNAVIDVSFLKPSFMGSINIINSTGETNCFVKSNKGKIPCKNSLLNLRYIPREDQRSITITLTPNNNNFTLKMDAYLNYLINIPVKSKTFKCINQEKNLYSCNQI